MKRFIGFASSLLLVLAIGACKSAGNSASNPVPQNAQDAGSPANPISTPSPQPPATSILQVGMNIHLDASPMVKQVAEMGAKWVRIDMNWSIMEPSEGQWN